MPKLTEAEIADVLTTGALVRVATVGTDGFPLIVPVAYLYNDERILLTARAKVAWLANIRVNPKVCAVIDQSRYPLRKVTVVGPAEILYEPGQDDQWRELRLPLADDSTAAPAADVPGAEWSYDAAYHLITYNEPRALVSIPLARAKVTSWRLPLEGEELAGSWAARYYDQEPRRFRVTAVGPRLGDVRVVAE
jgi:hypothetical protein